jgi:hypothetical protein
VLLFALYAAPQMTRRAVRHKTEGATRQHRASCDTFGAAAFSFYQPCILYQKAILNLWKPAWSNRNPFKSGRIGAAAAVLPATCTVHAAAQVCFEYE